MAPGLLTKLAQAIGLSKQPKRKALEDDVNDASNRVKNNNARPASSLVGADVGIKKIPTPPGPEPEQLPALKASPTEEGGEGFGAVRALDTAPEPTETFEAGMGLAPRRVESADALGDFRRPASLSKAPIRRTDLRSVSQLQRIFDYNKTWSRSMRDKDPEFFTRLMDQQNPEYLFIGCADSRVPADQITGLAPGNLFVHRNVANLVSPSDPNALSVIEFAVGTLKVSHIIVCGHYRCGGVRAAMNMQKSPIEEPLRTWLQPLCALCEEHNEELDKIEEVEEKWRFVCEESVRETVRTVESLTFVQDAWDSGQKLAIHGWVYDLADGMLHDLNVTAEVGFD